MNSTYRRWIVVSGFAVASLALLGAVQSAKTDYASVNLDKVVTECKQHQELQKELDAKQRMYIEALQSWYNRPLLTEAEFLTIVKVITNAKATDAEKAAMQKTLDTATERNKELNSLRSKPSPTEAEKQRLQELTRQEQGARELLQRYSVQYKSELDTRRSERSKEINSLVKITLAEVSKKKGCAVVFNSLAAVYSETDLTQAVLDEVNKRK